MEAQPLSMAQLSALAAASPTNLSATELVDTLADYEADVTLLVIHDDAGADAELISNFYATYLMALLLVDDLSVTWSILLTALLTSITTRNEARFLTQRLPSQIADTDHTILNVKRLLRATWLSDYTSVHHILQRTQWPDLLKPLAERYRGMRLTRRSLFTAPYGTG